MRAKRGLGIITNAQDARKDALYIEPFLYIRAETWMELYTFNPGPPCVRGYEALKNTSTRRQLDVCLSSRAKRRGARHAIFSFNKFRTFQTTRRWRADEDGSNQSRKCNFRGKHSHQATTRIAGIGSIDICLKGLASRRS